MWYNFNQIHIDGFNMLDATLRQYTQHAPHVQEIIKPMQTTGITGVFYVRIYPDGTIINIANDANWTEYYFSQLNNKIYQNKDVIDQFFISSGISLWEFNAVNPIWQDAKNYFGYKNGIVFIDNKETFKEAFCFYSTADNQAMNHFYINHIDTLKNMKQHFLSQSMELIQQAEHERQLLQHAVFPQIFDLPHAGNHESNTINAISPVCVFHKKTGIPTNLSPQRSQCFLHLMQGKSTKAIAEAMSLSPKTVEHYLEMLRRELGCRSSKELILHYANQVN